MNDIIQEEIVLNKIFLIRGQKVLLDEDLSLLYQVETKRLNEQVKRNKERFPADFAFQLTPDEFENLKSQFATSSWGGRRKLPFAFTELGIAMLSSVLKSQKAIQVNIFIMRIFAQFRQTHLDLIEIKSALQAIDQKTNGNSKSIELLFEYMDEIMNRKEEPLSTRKQIGFKTPK